VLSNRWHCQMNFGVRFGAREQRRPEVSKRLTDVIDDTHSPTEYLSDTVRNVDAWYDTYKIAPAISSF